MRDIQEVRATLAHADPARAVMVERPVSLPSDLIARAEQESESAAASTRRRAGRLGLIPRLAIGAAAVVGAVAAVGVPLLQLGGGDSAYAVTVQDDHWVRVEIQKQLEDAAGFERALEDAGVPTQVEHLPAGKTCEDRGITASKAIAYEITRTGETSGKLTNFLVDPRQFDDGKVLVVEVHANRAKAFVAQTPYRCDPVDW